VRPDLQGQGIEVTVATSGLAATRVPACWPRTAPASPPFLLGVMGTGWLAPPGTWAPLGVPILTCNVGGHFGFSFTQARQLPGSSPSTPGQSLQRLRDDRFAWSSRMSSRLSSTRDGRARRRSLLTGKGASCLMTSISVLAWRSCTHLPC